MVNTREYNNKRFSIFESEEKTALELMNKLGQACNEALDRTDEVEILANDNKNNKVSYNDLHTKYQLTTDGDRANFDGSWQGLKNPSLCEEGLGAMVNNIIVDLNVNYPRLVGENDDYERVKRAIDGLRSGERLLLPLSTLDFNNKQLYIYKSNISIIGKCKPVFDETTRTMKNGTIIKNGTISIEAIGTTVENIGVYLDDTATVVDGITTGNNAYDIKINNCCVKAKEHCFISQGINTKRIRVKNCEAYDTTHGFVSKVNDLIFENCYAEKCATNGFVFVSDNIGNATRVFTCKYNKAINCTANYCGGSFTMYGRDMYSNGNKNGIILSDLLLENCTSINARWQGFSIGDNKANEESVCYVQVENITLKNIVEKNTTPNFSVIFAKCKNVIVDGISQESNPFNVIAYSENVKMVNTLNGQKLDGTQLLPIGNNQPRIYGSGIYLTNNSSVDTVDYTNFLNAKKGDVITIIFKDDNSMVQNLFNKIELTRDFYFGKGCLLILEYSGSKWVEVYGHQVPRKSGVNTLLNITTNTNVDLNQSNIINVTGSGTTTNKITVTNFNRNSDILTFVIMPTYGQSLVYGGFDTTLFTEPTNIKKTLTSGAGQVLQFVFEPAIYKYVCINCQDVKQV